MAKTVIGLFDTALNVQRAVQELTDQRFSRDDIRIAASEAAIEDPALAAGAGTVASGPGRSVDMGQLKRIAEPDLRNRLIEIGLPEEEAGAYAEGVRRGGILLAVDVEEDYAGQAADILERHHPIDIEQRIAAWRQSGWAGYKPAAEPYTTEEIRREQDRPRQTPGMKRPGAAAEETTVPVVEEQVQVGKRTVERPVRVYTRVTEKPVEQQVHLREEHVQVERRPVDRPARADELNAATEGTIKVTETREEPVVAKQARVVEEVAVHKEVGERTETVRDTARRTDVEVEQQEAEARTGTTDFTAYTPDFRQNFQTTFAARRGATYEGYEPAYRYGYTLATERRAAGRDWPAVEAEARREWEARHQGNWDDVKDAVRYAWERARGSRPRAA